MRKSLVIGGTSGLGYELAKELSLSGAVPYIVGRTALEAAERDTSSDMVGIAADLLDLNVDEQIMSVLSDSDVEDIEYFVIAGGVHLRGNAAYQSTTSKRNLERIVYQAPTEILTVFHARKQSAYHLITIASTAAKDLKRSEAVYASAQAGRRAFSLNFQTDLMAANTVSKNLVVCPGGMKTDLWEGTTTDTSAFMDTGDVARIIRSYAERQANPLVELTIRRSEDGRPMVEEHIYKPELYLPVAR